MTPQVNQANLDGRDRGTATAPDSMLAPSLPVERQEKQRVREAKEAVAPHELTSTERQGLAMAWVGITLTMLLLLGGLGLWAAAALGGGFGGWLLAVGVLGLVMVVTVVAILYAILAPRR